MKKEYISIVRSASFTCAFTAFFLLIIFNGIVFSQTYTPRSYWTFNTPVPTKDSMNTANLDFSTYGCNYVINNGLVGKCLTLDNNPSLITAGAINLDSAFTIEFLIKPGYKFNTSSLFGRLDNAVGGSMGEDYIAFTTRTKTGSGAIINDELRVQFDGIGRKSLGYYVDGNWHHMVFKYNAITGLKEIWVDAQRPNGFSRTLTPGLIETPSGANKTFMFESTVSYVQYFGDIDEIAVYSKEIPQTLIYKHYLEAMAGTPYSFTNAALTMPATSPTSAGIDLNEYPPGHPNVTITATDQLKTFPLPRYKPGHTLKRNFNWMDPTYMSGWTQSGITYAQSVTNSVNIIYEMAKNWNYYLVASQNTNGYTHYNDTTHQGGAWVKLCNQNPQIPCQAITFWPQTNPAEIGRASTSPYIWSTNLPANHFLRNANGNFIDPYGNVTSNKYWTPTRPLDSIYYDGQTQRFYLQQLLNSLTRPLNIINENAEVIPLLQTSAMSQDPAVVSDKNASGLDWPTYFGNRKEKVSSYYKNQFMSLPALSNTIYTEYAVDGQQDWRPKYSEARKTNSQINGQYYATPDFYPRWPNNWRYWQSAWHGWQWIVDCRKNELAVGDKLYSPFVAAGWDSDEEKNMRPAQWLGLLKVLGMTGAEFYYSAYFNLTFPMTNPASYTWQAAMPAYAQAITSRFEDLLRNGFLMDGDVGNTNVNPNAPGYAFKAGDLRKLVVIRKHNTQNKYAITGTIQPNNNMVGNAELEGNASITLNGQSLKFKIRRQGSTYIYDNTIPSSPVFYQLDEWQEASHPIRWSKDFSVEGEMYDNTTPTFVIKTTVPAGTPAGDFTNYTSFVTYNDTSAVLNPMAYTFTPRDASNSTYYLWIRARSRGGVSTGASIAVDNGTALNISCITDTAWTWYRYDACSQQAVKFMNLSLQSHTLNITPANSKFELDKFLLTTNGGLVLNPAPPSCSASLATITSNGSTSICQGSNVVLTASSGLSYLWSNGKTTQSITVTTGGNYTVAVGMAGGCSATSIPVTVTVTSPSATITAGGPTTFCQGATVVLTASQGNAYEWSNGATTQAITVSTSGTYGVKITVNSCTASAPGQVVTVSPIPIAVVNASGPLSFCQGGSVTLTASTGASYLWTPGGQTTSSINVTSSGSYSVRVTNSGGCSATSSAAIVNVSNAPIASIVPSGNTTNLCPGSTVQLTASNGQSYLWSNGSTTQTITVNTGGNYTVSVSQGSGCSAIAPAVQVSYSTNPAASITASGSLTFCQGGSVTLTASQGSSFQWSDGSTTQSINATGSGNYDVIVTNAYGCTSQSPAVTVSVNNTAAATITESGPTTFCQGGSVTLTANQGNSYYWYPNGETTQSINVTASGFYYVVVTVSGGCTGSSAIKQVTVNPIPAAVITPGGSTVIQQGQTLTLTSSLADGYLWLPGGQATQSITVSDTGYYSVMTFSLNGCAATSAKVHVTYAPVTANITANGSTTICSGDNVMITATGGTGFLWSTGATSQSIAVGEGGTYTVTVTDANNGTSTAAIDIIVNSKPMEPSVMISYISNTAYQLTAYEPSAQSYSWSNGSTSQTILVTGPGAFTVTAMNGFGCTNSSKPMTVTSVASQTCVASNMLTAFDILDTSATLEWNPSITGTGFNVVYYEKGSVNFQTKSVSGNSYKTTLNGLSPGKIYMWFVQTVCNTGSYYSQVASFNTLAGSLNCGSTPLNPTTTNIRAKAATITWYPTSCDQFTVRYRKAGTQAYSYKTLSGVDYVSGGAKLTALIPATAYEWSVQTECSGVTSLYTNDVLFVTHDECPAPVFTYTTAVTNNSATLHWEETLPADTIRIKYYEKGTTNYKFRNVLCSPINPGYFVLNNLAPKTTYIYMIRGKCAWGASDFSNEKEFNTMPDPNIPLSDEDGGLKLIGYPNPANVMFNYGFTTEEEGDYTLMVCDMTGRILINEKRTAQMGVNGGSVNVETMANGLYTLILQKKAQTSRFKFSVD